MKKPFYRNDLTIVYNGDCLEVMDDLIERGVKVDAIITDPPYGLTKCDWDSVIPLDEMWDRLNKLSKTDRTPTILFSQQPFTTDLINSNRNNFKYEVVWDKKLTSGFLNANRRPLRQHENILLFYKKQNLYNPQKTLGKELHLAKGKSKYNNNINNNYGEFKHIKSKENTNMKFPKSIWSFQKPKSAVNKKLNHPTEKPIELMEYLIKTYTNKGDLILYFTAGSCTTCIASQRLGRRSIGIELERKYYNIGVDRLKKESVK